MGSRTVQMIAMCALLLATAGCSGRRERGIVFDSGIGGRDATVRDGGTPDAGGFDAGDLDAGTPDAGPADAGAVDAGPPDAGGVDAGPPDAGPPDSGPPDSGPPDSGPPDAGPPDAGCVPSGAAGPRSPTAATNDATVGSRSWSALTNVYASDSGGTSTSGRAYVSAMVDYEVSNYLVTGGYGFAIPSTATIDGIELEIERRALSGVGLVDDAVRLVKGGVVQSTDRSTSGTWTSTESYVSYGGPTDLWGTTWTPAEINSSGFGAALSVLYDNFAGNDWPLVDHVRITVHFTNSCP